MAVGTSALSDYTRNQLISDALRKVRAFPPDGRISLDLHERAMRALNRVVRHEDLRGVGDAINQWSISSAPLLLVADSQIYSDAENLKTNIVDLLSVVYRNSEGVDTPMAIVSRGQYDALQEKDIKGDPDTIYFERTKLLIDQRFWVYPVKDSLTTSSTVLGTDGFTTFTCILSHTSDSTNRPTTGASWELYWHAVGSGGSAWVTATAYTNPELIYYSYKAPLFDFGGQYDNPSFPSGFGSFLMWKLALDLAPEFNIGLEERMWLERMVEKHYTELVPTRKVVSTETHNKTLYY